MNVLKKNNSKSQNLDKKKKQGIVLFSNGLKNKNVKLVWKDLLFIFQLSWVLMAVNNLSSLKDNIT